VLQHNVCVALATTAAPVPKLTPNMLVSTLDLWHIVSRLTWGRFFQPCLPIQSMTPNSHQSCGQTNDDIWILEGADWWTVWRMMPVSLCDI